MINKKFFISQDYQMKTFDEFEQFSNDILYRKVNRKLYQKKRFIIAASHLMELFNWLLMIIVTILFHTVINKDEHFALYLGLLLSTTLLQFIPFIWWGIYSLNSESPFPNKSAPLTWDKRLYPMSKSDYSYNWIQSASSWCPDGYIDFAIVKLLTIFNKMDKEDRKYIFDLVMKKSNAEHKTFLDSMDSKKEEILKRNNISTSKLNCIYGLISMLKYTDFSKSFCILKEPESETRINKDISTAFWWVIRIDVKSLIVYFVSFLILLFLAMNIFI